MTITEFLEARIAEDEAVALAASGSTVEGEIGAWSPVSGGDQWAVGDGDFEVEVLVALRPSLPLPPKPLSGYWGAVTGWQDLEHADRAYVLPLAEHIARHDPARVLAECAAKRAIIEACERLEDQRLDSNDWSMDLTSEVILGPLAAVYADHADYQQEWAK